MNFSAVVLLFAASVGQAVSPGHSEVPENRAKATAIAGQSESAQAVEARKQGEQRLDVLKRVAAAYEIHVGPDHDTQAVLRPEPLLHWANHVRFSLDGATFIWTAKGRPHAVASIYSSTDQARFRLVDHEFQSLSPGPLIARRHGARVWFPSKAGVTMKPFPDAPAPAKMATLRLVQMRRLASRFTATGFPYDPQSKEQWQLRLIPQPLHRYGKEDDELIDGSLFVFAQGTDPEVVVILEAVDSESGPVWNYGLARMCGLPLEVRLGGTTIWKAPLRPVSSTPDGSKAYVTFYQCPIEN